MKNGYSNNILKKYEKMRLNKSKSNTYARIRKPSKINKKQLMKIIRDHSITGHIKATFQNSISEFDFKKQNSGFNYPTIVSSSENTSKVIGKYFNVNNYVAGRTTEFKRTIAEYFVPKVYKIQKNQRNVLLNYSPFKYFEMQAKQFPKRQYLCAIILSKHLAATIATRRSEWINIFFYKFHQIGDLAKSLLAKEKLANPDDKKMHY